MSEPRLATPGELTTWDERTVHVPGGHVYQSRTWAEQRARLGWTPLHVILDPSHAALVLTRPWPMVGGRSAYIPRGPVSGDEPAERAAERLTVLADWLGRDGVDVVATDAEIPAAETGYGAVLERGGFHPILEIQPSRHRLQLELARDTDDGAVRSGLSKGTRQRVSAAEQGGVVVTRYDAAGWRGGQPLFQGPPGSPDPAFETFATLLEGTGEQRGFRFGPRGVFIDWWRAAHAAGLLVYLEAADERDADGRVLGGLMLYRHGGRLSTVHSADAPGARDRQPGTMHLLRWRAIQLAIREGCSEMDLGGADIAPGHAEPRPGDPTFGLYEHKRSFGAVWVAMTGARERVIRPWRYALGRVASRAARVADAGRGARR